MKDGAKPKAHTKAAQAHEVKTRKSATGMSGLPKKGGHGGKFTWAGNDGLDVADVVDAKDPNFEDPLDVADLSP